MNLLSSESVFVALFYSLGNIEPVVSDGFSTEKFLRQRENVSISRTDIVDILSATIGGAI